MMKASCWLLLLVVVLSLMVASPVAASTPAGVSITVVSLLNPESPDPVAGEFVVSDPAVGSIICPAGDVVDIFSRPVGWQSQNVIILKVGKRFICDDGSGTFDVLLLVRLTRKGDDFRWVIRDGTGAYEDLHGRGSGTGEGVDGVITDLYVGKVHID